MSAPQIWPRQIGPGAVIISGGAERYVMDVPKGIDRKGFYIDCHPEIGVAERDYICRVFDQFFQDRVP